MLLKTEKASVELFLLLTRRLDILRAHRARLCSPPEKIATVPGSSGMERGVLPQTTRPGLKRSAPARATVAGKERGVPSGSTGTGLERSAPARARCAGKKRGVPTGAVTIRSGTARPRLERSVSGMSTGGVPAVAGAPWNRHPTADPGTVVAVATIGTTAVGTATRPIDAGAIPPVSIRTTDRVERAVPANGHHGHGHGAVPPPPESSTRSARLVALGVRDFDIAPRLQELPRFLADVLDCVKDIARRRLDVVRQNRRLLLRLLRPRGPEREQENEYRHHDDGNDRLLLVQLKVLHTASLRPKIGRKCPTYVRGIV